MMTETQIEAIKILLASPKKITIIPHRNPDGDAMGSTLGLYHFLIQQNHEVVVMSPNEFPDFLAWLPASENTFIFEKDKENCIEILNKSDIIFTLDFNALHRTGNIMQATLETLQKTFVMIDHHEFPDDFAKYTFSDTKYGSTCEMVYHFIHQLKQEELINTTVATCIYTGIVTDSGSFRFPKTTSTTHRIVADLIDKGVENSTIYNQLFDKSSYSRLQLLGRALQNMKLMTHYKTSYITLSQEELDTYNFEKGDTEGIVNYGLSIDGIDFTAIFIENSAEGIVKISFRSQGSFDVNQFSRNYFGGGGHINAAGGKSDKSLQETIADFERIVKEIKK
ncbi:bifunctional oligoribonuclease/PAP phosphatase NrnA [Flavobacterium psychrophilum]|uniref:Phosphoesterase, DHH family protein n=6 Tax=Flavobacterium psychrophilum TaxID=96345 RepID=A6H0T5_FLAPJ|nr:bifunctional oligoribonuclease/PAP phosphatase NrnA [Flavobacterium psychrophilum]AIG30641.1 exopolyphosphatase [Flavobacterium psychrophilum]AIG32916.1 exopolyphosphatase [Flavobacterium psychrophilum]AIG35071.1 exopolyphosphatase [Flavobacterium psychrophilum]AIG37436.1 exopolyphosphatase [Flavobacterium psychrophilum]AIG39700.1 exopolyphosphatase [Flavobacterium psychrophilum]